MTITTDFTIQETGEVILTNLNIQGGVQGGSLTISAIVKDGDGNVVKSEGWVPLDTVPAFTEMANGIAADIAARIKAVPVVTWKTGW